ncbi:MAG: alpha/beta fold hydrolase [Verrucomicrobia bacterium]|nr:alpha/beta fold hydrolase [Verrucomicrobiota bacterium]
MTASTQTLPAWLRMLYPFTLKTFATSGGAKMSYVDERGTGQSPGDDSAVLLVHGNPTWSFYYRHAITALVASGRRCIAPDHIGMGLSEKPQDYKYTLAQRITDLESLVLSLGLKQIDLVVHDWGGAIGFGLAVRHPQLIRRIVILNSAAYPMDQIPKSIALCKTSFPGSLIVRTFNGFARAATKLAMNRRTLTNDEKNGYLFPYDSFDNRVGIDAFIKDIPDAGHPSFTTLRRVADGLDQFRRRKVLMIWGANDFCFDANFFEEWRKYIPEAKVHLIADAGHYVADDAYEQVSPMIVNFFKA